MREGVGFVYQLGMLNSPRDLPIYSTGPLAVVLPRPASGAGTLIPSAQRFVSAANALEGKVLATEPPGKSL